MALVHLYTRDVVRIAGAGAQKLLHDTLTCRFDDTLAGVGRWFALLSPQGKVQAEGLVTLADNAWWFDLEAGTTADFVRRMKMYRLRAKADIDVSPDHAVLWTDGAERPTGTIAYRDERGIGTRFIVSQPAGREVAGDLGPYHRQRAALGVPELGPDFGVSEVFPHDIGMDLLDGIDFLKGCYVGQEVVSRMKHRGTARRRPVIVSGIDAAGPLTIGEREVGTAGLPVDGKAVAVVRLDRIEDPAMVTAGQKSVTLTLPPWATYAFGESAAAE